MLQYVRFVSDILYRKLDKNIAFRNIIVCWYWDNIFSIAQNTDVYNMSHECF